MLTTHAAASKKACPLMRVANKLEDSMCVGYDCMLWRWDKLNDGFRQRDDELGYCGLGGRP